MSGSSGSAARARPRLGVNVDHVATLRQARGVGYPDPLEAAQLALGAGADGITVHLREDRRHIQDADVERLRALVAGPLNLEMAVADTMVAFALRVRPAAVCLVPERREELTTEGGLDVTRQLARVRAATERLASAAIRVSCFIDPEETQVEASRAAGAHAVELHTGDYANAASPDEAREQLARIARAGQAAWGRGLVLHAGHGLTVANVGAIAALPGMAELNIGHSIVARAVLVGMAAAVREMVAAMTAVRA
jgi:pyridoxine 5-phosphate synthase